MAEKGRDTAGKSSTDITMALDSDPSFDAAHLCSIRPGSNDCTKCEDIGNTCVKGETLPRELILEGLRMQVALSKTDIRGSRLVKLHSKLNAALVAYHDGHPDAIPEPCTPDTEDDGADKTSVHKANVEKRLAGFYKAVDAFKKLKIEDAYMDSSMAFEFFKAGAESVMELFEMPDEGQ